MCTFVKYIAFHNISILKFGYSLYVCEVKLLCIQCLYYCMSFYYCFNKSYFSKKKKLTLQIRHK